MCYIFEWCERTRWPGRWILVFWWRFLCPVRLVLVMRSTRQWERSPSCLSWLVFSTALRGRPAFHFFLSEWCSALWVWGQLAAVFGRVVRSVLAPRPWMLVCLQGAPATVFICSQPLHAGPSGSFHWYHMSNAMGSSFSRRDCKVCDLEQPHCLVGKCWGMWQFLWHTKSSGGRRGPQTARLLVLGQTWGLAFLCSL